MKNDNNKFECVKESQSSVKTEMKKWMLIIIIMNTRSANVNTREPPTEM